MGGSASNENTRLFDLMSQYSGDSDTTNGQTSNGSSKEPIPFKKALRRELRRQSDAGAGVGGMHYNMGGLWNAIFQTDIGQRFLNGGDGGYNTGGNSPVGNKPGLIGGGQGGAPLYWQFPQYSQSWAFTPPAPTPYMNPPAFDPKKYGDPLSKKNK